MPTGPVDVVERIEVWSKWLGFASPPFHAARLTIFRDGNRFRRQQALGGPPDELPAELVAELLAALARSSVAKLEPVLFDLPKAVITSHYGSMWTDDHPEHLFRIVFADSRIVSIHAPSQYAWMLPLEVTDFAAKTSKETFDPHLSRTLAAVLPDGYLEKDRLAGRLGMLELDLERQSRPDESAVPELPEVGMEAETRHSAKERLEAAEQELFRLLRGDESPEEREESERAGRLSERLLRRISAEEVRDLLARGADSNVADDRGQTALMNAAWPPFDREKFRLLAKAGADVEARRFDGLTGLHIACAGGEFAAAAAWVRAGANVNTCSPEGATPLMLAATWPAIVRVLLKAGAEVNAADADGHTPLAYAVLNQSWLGDKENEAVCELLAAGANPLAADRQGITPAEHARRVVQRLDLEEEVRRAFHPGADEPVEWVRDERLHAETIAALIATALFP